MIKVYFIINPISGKGKHNITQEYVASFFNKDTHRVVAHYSTYKKHAIELTQQALREDADIIVACGGDGTIHEVATELVGKEVAFGIVPVGSGNGLASNLSIPKDIEKAIIRVRDGHVIKMDVGTLNGEYFFSNMGFGIDATIIDKYERSGKRKLGAYIKASLNSAQEFKAKRVQVTYNGMTKEVNPLLLFISNSNEMGYNMSLTPKASLTDGLLDYLMVPKINLFKQLTFGVYVLFKMTDKFRKTDYIQTDHIIVEIPDQQTNGLQMDGEYYEFDANKFEIKVLKGALQVIC
ncbi:MULTISPECIES: diacylglycerol/lipid kinase family protein [Myroides]|uniref:YegS/Rv2252/BmrU family lipid kinase n=1 Tax=Myroides albus TaxID=2562892 RepID=A0A6I3LRD4_9FLAO|nr:MULTISPECIES: diacylglycerol kinase family protein [Myroides]MTG98525.1 YegS/Rv2252/BmrU family lipid kinase [Myroides albus]MVX34932.1 YegS/Rv2252/BmrU family lipid kinase [Myroides sp. LoEW2-1]